MPSASTPSKSLLCSVPGALPQCARVPPPAWTWGTRLLRAELCRGLQCLGLLCLRLLCLRLLCLRLLCLRLLCFGLLCSPASSLQAEELLGYLTGPNNLPVTGATLTLQPPKGEARILQSDGQGFFRISDLPPGVGYQVRIMADGYAPFQQDKLEVLSGRKTHLSLRLTPSRPGVGTVTELADPTPLDASFAVSLESKTHSSLLYRPGLNAWLQRSTGAMNETLVASTIGPAASGLTFAGAGLSEQLFRLDGVDITHPLTGQLAFEFPVELLDRVESGLGGIPVSEGDVTGGVVLASSRFGGNHLSGDLFLYGIPWQEASPALTEGADSGTGALTRLDRLVMDLQAGFGLGGAILGDRIWFFLGAAPRLAVDQTDRCIAALEDPQSGETFSSACDALSVTDGLADADTTTGRLRTYTTRLDAPGLMRLTFNLTPDQTLQLGAYGQQRSHWGIVRPTTFWSTGLNGEPSTWLGEDRRLNLAGGGRYQLRLPAFRTRVVLRAGYLHTQEELLPDSTDREADGSADGAIQRTSWQSPISIADTSCGSELCTRAGWMTGGYGELHQQQSNRLELHGQVSSRFPELLGDHLASLGGGIKQEAFSHTTLLTGGGLTERSSVEGGELLTTQSLLELNHTAARVSLEGSTQLVSGFLDDLWQINEWVELRPGLRFLSQTLLDSGGTSTTLATAGSLRLAGRFSYSVKKLPGSLSASLSGHRGTVPLWLWEAARATPERKISSVFIPTAAEGARTSTSSALYTPLASSAYRVDSAATLPALQEYSAHLTQALPGGLRLELGALHRSLSSTIDAVLYPSGVVWLTRPGRSDEDGASDVSRCFEASLRGETQTYCLEEPNRRFTGYSARLERIPTEPGGIWLLVDYLYSTLEGGSPGLTAHPSGTDPYSVQTWYAWEVLRESVSNDETLRGAFRSGVLPFDRTHRGRLELAFELPIGLRLGGALQARSGMPVDVRVPSSWVEGGLPRLFSPGAAGRTGWVLDDAVQLGYRRSLGANRDITFTATVFNPLNRKDVVQVDPRALLTGAPVDATTVDYSADALPATGCTQAGSTSDAKCLVNEHFGAALEVQLPRTVQLMARFSF